MNVPETTPQRAFRAAVSLCKSQRQFARLIGKSPARITQMLSDERSVCPAESVIAVEAATGISRHALRPDIYPTEGVGDV